ncbi:MULTISPECIES: DUF2474 domain-containing protein [unclassified Pseudomonas]|uniref:DUF2474 domain-containing protein n=1 Tax=unclassified Pseudomonas TaxID=196821 RepID=UPI0025D6CA3F|nr:MULTISPECIES: DUF2474 domain-containing protein [unclassified Pseudomonas]
MSSKESFPERPAHEPDPAQNKPLWQRLGWLVIIWTGSVLALFVVASVLRMFMTAAGMRAH